MAVSEPTVVSRPPQAFAAKLVTVRQPEIARVGPALIDEVVTWLNGRGEGPAGPSFFNYVDFLEDDRMVMHAGVPTTDLMEADGDVVTGIIPAGRFATMTLTGPYEELRDVNMALGDWMAQNGLRGDGTGDGMLVRGANRMEIYLKDPGEDPSGLPVTEVAFRLA